MELKKEMHEVSMPLPLPLRWMKCSWRLLAWLLQAYPGAPGVLLAAPSLLLAAPGVGKAPGGSWPAPGGSWPPGLLLAAPPPREPCADLVSSE